MEVRILHHEGRMVAVCKGGVWNKIEGVTPDEFGRAIHNGTIEFLTADEIEYGMVDVIYTLAVCILTLGCGIFIWNLAF